MPAQPSSNSGRATTPSATGAPSRTPQPCSTSSQSSASYRDSGLGVAGVFALLLAFRIVNAVTLRTFFQPDEFYQSLEPAWQLAFGDASKPWITWEWRAQLRSCLHPGIFAGVYLVAAKVSDLCGLSLTTRADLLIAAPKVAQAVFAALLDCYTWRLAEKVYGRASHTAFTALALSICSPWQWFCSTRTLSNCLETAITSTAVYYWPWHLPSVVEGDSERADRDQDQDLARIASEDVLGPQSSNLRLSLMLAAFACIFRPTNALVWLAVSIPTLWQSCNRLRDVLVREILICGSAVLACSILLDKAYYHAWTLPPLRFLYFNIAQSLAVFYGRNRPDYYLTEGLPLLLTTALPFALVGLYQALRAHSSPASRLPSGRQPAEKALKHSAANSVTQHPILPTVPRRILVRLAWTCVTTTLSLSLISHKEVRFLYPILPFLHVLSAQPLSSFFFSSRSTSSTQKARPGTHLTSSALRRSLLMLILAINLLVAGYASQVHQRGVIDVLSYLRHKHESRISSDGNSKAATTSVGFLMPCHSTPWRSHLVHPGISAWALTCEPPLDVPLSERATYLDEADQFYVNPGPANWLKDHMEHVVMIASKGSRSSQHWGNLEPAKRSVGRRVWPHNLVFFEQLEDVLKDFLKGTRYKECWRGFNSHFHDDWRRVGDVIVWCMD